MKLLRFKTKKVDNTVRIFSDYLSCHLNHTDDRGCTIASPPDSPHPSTMAYLSNNNMEQEVKSKKSNFPDLLLVANFFPSSSYGAVSDLSW